MEEELCRERGRDRQRDRERALQLRKSNEDMYKRESGRESNKWRTANRRSCKMGDAHFNWKMVFEFVGPPLV